MRLITTMLLALSFTVSAADNTEAVDSAQIEQYARFDQWQDVKISPKGDYISALTWQNGKESLATFDTNSLKPVHQIKFRTSNSDAEYYWATPTRLVTKKLFAVKRLGSVRNVNTRFVNHHTLNSEFYGINADGTAPRYLYTIKNGRVQAGKIAWTDIIDAHADDDDYLLAVGSPYDDADELPMEVFKVNVKYGRAIKVAKSPVYNPKFLTDINHQLRFVTGYDDKFRIRSYLYKDEKWLRLDTLNRRTNQSFEPIALDGDSVGVYAYYSKDGGPRGLYHFNLKSGYRTKVFQHKTVDLDKIMFDNNNFVYAVSYDDGTPTTKIVDHKNPDGKALQNIISELPDQTVQIVSQTDDGTMKIVYASGQQDPGSYWLYDTKSRNLKKLFDKRSWVTPDSMAKVVPMNYLGGGDLKLSGYVTLPPGINSIEDARNLPFVVKVHGGPHGHRDRMKYDSEAQLYANHGMGVLQVNFRGSGGFGAVFRSRGYKRWSTDIQMDIIDGIKSLVDKGVADPNRLCVVGASFGGFSAMQSSILAPDLFKCAVALNGAYDLGLLYKIGRLKDTKMAKHELTLSLGIFTSKLKASSPIEHLDKLKASVLVIHGENDRRVPIKHFEKLTDKLKFRGHDHQAIVIDNMRHGFSKASQRQEVFSHSLAFLKKHLGINQTQGTHTKLD